ncbi:MULTISPECIES: DUF4345 domain-containing protein [unclassified Mycobacterium]|uniref:DUF4345 domain-containing protein n=1 Tax=unclassified Mycobacterium TaxID=2642494 RepID=UPI0029C6CC24|nr:MULTISPECIES: DUF4345 domain-containing protein [unclassified Mycobacterium]
MKESGRSRRSLQRTLAVLAVIPMASALGEIARGAKGVPGGSPDVVPTVDSSLRYANVFKLAVGPVIWSQLGSVEQSRGLTFALSTIFVGGLARIRSWQESGRPHPVSVVAIALETVGISILLVWKRRLSSSDISVINGAFAGPSNVNRVTG